MSYPDPNQNRGPYGGNPHGQPQQGPYGNNPYGQPQQNPYGDPARGGYDNRYQEEMQRQAATAPGQNAFLTRVFGWMAMGLGLTAVAAYVTLMTGFYEVIFSSSLHWVLFAAEIGLVFWLSARLQKMSVGAAIASFLIYSLLNGVTLSIIFLIYTSGSIASTFLITAATFGFMFVWGWTTKRDLTSMGSLLIMGLFGFIIASIVNWFLQSEALYWIATYIGIAIFVGLTAWDAQKIKRMNAHGNADADYMQKNAIMGALMLYLDFINLFLLLLRIFGDRR